MSGRAGLVVSALGAPANGHGSNVHSALGTTFNGRNSSGLLYMHHSSLNNMNQTMNSGPSNGGGNNSQNSTMI